MVLKHRGYKENWCYVEAPSFVVAHVLFPQVCAEPEDLDERSRQIKDCENYIINQVGLHGAKINYLLGEESIRELHRCTVAVSDKTEPLEAYVLCNEAYLMTDTGKTIERIA